MAAAAPPRRGGGGRRGLDRNRPRMAALWHLDVTPGVDKLEALGLVTRVTSPQDRRIKSVLLTAAGEALLQHLTEAAGQAAQQRAGDQGRDWGDQHAQDVAQVRQELAQKRQGAQARLNVGA